MRALNTAATGMQAQALSQLQPDHRQGDRDAATGTQHRIEVAVVRVVVVVEVAAEIQVAEKELIERAQALQMRGIGRQAALEPGQQLIDIAEHLLHIEVGVVVLGQAGRGLQQRKVLVAVHQTAEIFQRRGDVEL